MKLFIKYILPHKFYKSLRWCYFQFGVKRSVFYLLPIIANKRIVKVPNNVDFRSVYIRLGTTDMDVYHELFNKKELDIHFNSPNVIIDAGAHIGLASIWFAIKYPNAQIYAIESENSNFEVLKLNSSIYNNIIPINKGLWKNSSFLEVETINRSNWAYSVKEVNYSTSLYGVSIYSLIEEYNIKRISILKIDIEGAEIEVFENSAGWIDKVDNIVIELHDRFREGCTEVVGKAVDNNFFSKIHSGEKIIYRKFHTNY